MKRIQIKFFLRILAINIVCSILFNPLYADNIDIYIVYSGKDKDISKSLKQEFQSNIKLKAYNVDLLALSDYSGKQKVVLKLERAKLIIITSESALESLEGISFNTDMIVLHSMSEAVVSKKIDLRIVKKEANLKTASKSYQIKGEKDIADIDITNNSKVFLVDESEMGLNKIVIMSATKLLDK